MPAKKNPHKEPDSAAVRNARSIAKRVAAGLCRSSSKHGRAYKWDVCRLCFAKKVARRSGKSVDDVLARLDLEESRAANENASPSSPSPVEGSPAAGGTT